MDKKSDGGKNREAFIKEVVTILNRLLEREYCGVIRYSHYSLMISGFNRIPIVKWFRHQSTESLGHAQQIGELITTLEGHPSLRISNLVETQQHSIEEILKESLGHETEQVRELYELLSLVENRDVVLEEFTRKMIVDEEGHISEVKKMLKNRM